MVKHGHAIPLEVVGTMIEMADVAWNALEHRRERKFAVKEEEEIAHLKSENAHLREVLAQNFTLLHSLSETPSLSEDCPPDLYARLEAAVDSSSFLTKLESLQEESKDSTNGNYPLVEATVNDDHGEPSLWVWVTKDMLTDNLEEASGIDNEGYIIISEKNVIDSIADFIANCIHENPKAKVASMKNQVLTSKELQKAVTKALGDIKKSKLKFVWETGKTIYSMTTWGLCLAGLYRSRSLLKAATVGISTTTKFLAKAL